MKATKIADDDFIVATAPTTTATTATATAASSSTDSKSGDNAQQVQIQIQIETNNTPKKVHQQHVDRELRWKNLSYSLMVDGGKKMPKVKRTLLDGVDGLVRQGQGQ